MGKGRISLKNIDQGLLLQLNTNHNSEFPGSQSKNENGGIGFVALLEPIIENMSHHEERFARHN